MSQSEAAVGPQPRVDSKETKVGAHYLPVAEGPLHPHPLVSQELEHWSAGTALCATCEQSLWVTVCQAVCMVRISKTPAEVLTANTWRLRKKCIRTSWWLVPRHTSMGTSVGPGSSYGKTFLNS